MARPKRAQLAPTDDWQQLQFQLDWTEQIRHELIRPVVVFGAAPVERAKQTRVPASLARIAVTLPASYVVTQDAMFRSMAVPLGNSSGQKARATIA
jgi:hypothetical protein